MHDTVISLAAAAAATAIVSSTKELNLMLGETAVGEDSREVVLPTTTQHPRIASNPLRGPVSGMFVSDE